MNKQQHGMTLVELMVSMTLSLSLIAGIGSLFSHTQKSNRIQRAMATMADDSSYVQEVLQKEIRRTGGLRSRSDAAGTNDRIFLTHNNVLNTEPTLAPTVPLLVTNIDFSGSEYIKGDATSPPNDAFAIRYQLLDNQDLSAGAASNGSSPCTQNILLDPGEDPSVIEHVANVYFYLNGTTLSCVAQRTLPNTSGGGGATETCAKNCMSTTDFHSTDTSVGLISNAIKLVMRYGVDSDADNAANYYADATQVTTALWQHVVSIRLSVVVRSEEDFLTNTHLSYQVEGTSYTATDYRLYKTFVTTIALRNQLL
ncbi:PilW family protein [Crenothrix polyspora]|uniref:Prepilin-type N-terminal cleavage/methylation domain-containing protein n=1 Tax=Crenothrix polyspora TaxID=360316 RepID=A0A1R4HAQ0_9GAMM|nr:PilW family protein [Crenothrix polyspora]SJM93342.1 conserved hypothetical protein [Crenothrix polyspora]